MYNYQHEKAAIFTEEGQAMFLKIMANVNECITKSGAVTMGRAIAGNGGEVWQMMACVDRLCELEMIRGIPQDRCAGQNRVFVAFRS